MKYTLLTNSASESRMAQLDAKVKYSGGAAPVSLNRRMQLHIAAVIVDQHIRAS